MTAEELERRQAAGAKFKDMRVFAGLTQADVARAAGATASAVSAWERGRGAVAARAWTLVRGTADFVRKMEAL